MHKSQRVVIEKQREDYERLKERMMKSEAQWVHEKRILEDEMYRYKNDLRSKTRSGEKTLVSQGRDRDYTTNEKVE